MSAEAKGEGTGPTPAQGATPATGAAHSGSKPAPSANGSGILLRIQTLGPDEKAIKREKIVDVLWDLQKKRGHIDDEAVRIAATECDMTPAEVDEVATFYNLLLRRPAGRRQIFVCDSISCELCGSARIMTHLTAVLGIQPGEVTADGEFALLPIVCLGHCERAPCLLVDEKIYGPLATDRTSTEVLVQKLRNLSKEPSGAKK